MYVERAFFLNLSTCTYSALGVIWQDTVVLAEWASR